MDDTIAWSTHTDKNELLKQLQAKASQMLEWCQTNRVLIKYDKVYLIFNEQSGKEQIKLNNNIISCKSSLKYLGITFKANTIENHSTITIDLKKPANDILQRCQYMRGIRKLNYDQQTFKALCTGFIGGCFNYYTPFLAAEIHPENKRILQPLKTAPFPSQPQPHRLHAHPYLHLHPLDGGADTNEDEDGGMNGDGDGDGDSDNSSETVMGMKMGMGWGMRMGVGIEMEMEMVTAQALMRSHRGTFNSNER